MAKGSKKDFVSTSPIVISEIEQKNFLNSIEIAENIVYRCLDQNMLDKIWRQFGRLHISSSMSQYALKTSLKQIFNIRFGHLIILISPNYNYTPTNPN